MAKLAKCRISRNENRNWHDFGPRRKEKTYFVAYERPDIVYLKPLKPYQNHTKEKQNAKLRNWQNAGFREMKNRNRQDFFSRQKKPIS